MRRTDDHPHVVKAGITADSRQDLPARHALHPDVEDQVVGHVFCEQRKRSLCRLGLPHRVAGLLQDEAAQQPQVRLVVDHDDRAHQTTPEPDWTVK